MALKKVTWTQEKNEQLLKMAVDGKSRKEIAYVIGTSEGAVSVRLSNLRKQGQDAPHIVKEASNVEKAQVNQTGGGEPSGELNDLEKTLSELVAELQGEKEELTGELTALQERCRNQDGTINDLIDRLSAAEDALRAARQETQDALSALAQTEKQMDEERVEHALCGQTDDTHGYANIHAIQHLNGKLEQLTKENARMLDAVLGMIERFVITGGEVQ